MISQANIQTNKSAFGNHSAPISGVATSREKYVATTEYGIGNKVIIWDSQFHTPIAQGNHDHLVNQCEFSPNGQLLVSASSDRTSRIWSVPDMRLIAILGGHSDDVMKASFNPSGEQVATCSYDGTLRIYNLNGNCLVSCEGHTGLIETFDWNNDGTEITSCGTDRTLRTWCTRSGVQIHLKDNFEHDMDTLVYDERGQYIIGDDEGSIIVFMNDKNYLYQAHTTGVKRLVKYKNMLLSIGYDQKAVLWRILPNGELNKISSEELPNAIWARSAAFLNSEVIVFASFGSTYISWNWTKGLWNYKYWQPSVSKNALIARGKDIFSIGDSGELVQNRKHIASIGSLCNCISLVDNLCFVAGQVGTIFNAFNQEVIFQHSSPINCCSSYIDSEGRVNIVFGAYDGSLIFLLPHSEAMDVVVRVIKLGCNAVKGIATCGDEIFCGSADGTLTIVDGTHKAKKSMRQGAHDAILNGVATYQDGFATVSRDLTMRLWDRNANLKKIVQTRHPRSIKCIASNPEGYLSATGSYGGTIDIYDHRVGQWVGDLKTPTMSGISSIAWSDYLGVFIASSYDGDIYHV